MKGTIVSPIFVELIVDPFDTTSNVASVRRPAAR